MKTIDVELLGEIRDKKVFWNLIISYQGRKKDFKGIAVSREELQEPFDLVCSSLKERVAVKFYTNLKTFVSMFEMMECDKISEMEIYFYKDKKGNFEGMEEETVLLPYMKEFSENFKEKNIDGKRAEFFASLVMAYMYFFKNKTQIIPDLPIVALAKKYELVEKDFEIEDFLVELEIVVDRS